MYIFFLLNELKKIAAPPPRPPVYDLDIGASTRILCNLVVESTCGYLKSVSCTALLTDCQCKCTDLNSVYN